MTYKCVVADDEPLARKVLIELIENIDQLEIVASCSDALEVLQFSKANQIDLLFLDINMPKLNGIEFKRSLQSDILTIFTTAYPDYAVDAFEVQAFDYLVKPISFERLFKTCQRAITSLESQNQSGNSDSIVIKENKRLYRIGTATITHIQAYGDYIRIFTPNKTYISKDRLSHIEASLSADFIKVHRSYIINANSINYIKGNFVMIGDQQIPISATGKAKLLDRL